MTSADATAQDARLIPAAEEAQTIASALRLSAHILDRYPDQLSAQLRGRLDGDRREAVHRLLEQARTAFVALSRNGTLALARPTLTPPGAGLMRIIEGHDWWIGAVAFSQEGRIVLSGSDDGTVRVWDFDTGQQFYCFEPKEELDLNSNGVTPPYLSAKVVDRLMEGGPEARRLARQVVRGSSDGGTLPHLSAKVVDRLMEGGPEARRLARQVARHTATGSSGTTDTFRWSWRRFRAVAITPDGRFGVAGASDGYLGKWSLRTGRQLAKVTTDQKGVRSVAISRDGQLTASGGRDHTVKLWRLDRRQDTFRELKCLPAHTGRVVALAFAPAGHILYSASADGTVRSWEVDSGALRHTRCLGKGCVQAASFSSDGKLVALASTDGRIQIYSLETDQVVYTSKGMGRYSHLAIDSDIGVCFSALDIAIGLWTPDTGSVRSIRGWRAATQALAVVNADQEPTSAPARQRINHFAGSSSEARDPGKFLAVSSGRDSLIWEWSRRYPDRRGDRST